MIMAAIRNKGRSLFVSLIYILELSIEYIQRFCYSQNFIFLSSEIGYYMFIKGKDAV